MKIPIPGIEDAITSNEALELERLPSTLVIIGGGYIAVEFASIFAALGVQVTQVIRGDHILNGFDDDVRTALEAEMVKRGIRICTRVRPERLERTTAGFRLCAADERVFDTELVMVATGRAPNSHGIGLEELGVAVNPQGAVMVDEWSRTTVPNIYALGDVTDRVALTPVAIAEGRAFAETLYNNNPTSVDYDNIPTAVFSTPHLGTVGLTEDRARHRFSKVDVYRTSFRPMKHTLSGRDERILVKLVVDAETDRVLGCHMLGNDAPEIVQGLAIALNCGATKRDFDRTIGLHPSAAEEFVTLREKVG